MHIIIILRYTFFLVYYTDNWSRERIYRFHGNGVFGVHFIYYIYMSREAIKSRNMDRRKTLTNQCGNITMRMLSGISKSPKNIKILSRAVSSYIPISWTSTRTAPIVWKWNIVDKTVQNSIKMRVRRFIAVSTLTENIFINQAAWFLILHEANFNENPFLRMCRRLVIQFWIKWHTYCIVLNMNSSTFRLDTLQTSPIEKKNGFVQLVWKVCL